MPPSAAPACSTAKGWSWGERLWQLYCLLCELPFTYKPSRATRQCWYAAVRLEAASDGGAAPSAAHRLLRLMNKANVGAEPVDLHGLHCAEAVGVVREVVESFTPEWPRWRHSSHVVAFGVGRGLNSRNGQSRLRPAVVTALQKSNIDYKDSPQDGCVFAVFYPPQHAWPLAAAQPGTAASLQSMVLALPFTAVCSLLLVQQHCSAACAYAQPAAASSAV